MAEPIRVGVPFAAGAFDGKAPLAVVGSDGVTRPVQTRVTDCWPDGSVRWLLVDFVLPVDAGTPAEWRGELRTSTEHPLRQGLPRRAMLQLARSPSARVCGAPAVRCSAKLPGGDDRRARVQFDARELSGGQGSFVSEEVTLENHGPLRATVRQTGRIGGLKQPLFVDARVTVFAGSPVFRVDVTVRNPKGAAHPGGTWDLGDPGSVMLERFTMTCRSRRARRSFATRLNRAFRT